MTASTHAAELPGRFVALCETGTTDVPLPVRLRYDTARPFEVKMTFGTPTSGEADEAAPTWHVSRELLIEGVTGSAGELDILLNTYALRGDDVTVVTLQPPRSTPAHVILPTFLLGEFLAATEELVPPGTESITTLAGLSRCPAWWELGCGEPDQRSGEWSPEGGTDGRDGNS